MNVNELINILKSYPENAIVRVLSVDDEAGICEYFPITSSFSWADENGQEYIDL